MKGTMLADVAESLEAAREASLKVGTVLITYSTHARVRRVEHQGLRTRPFLHTLPGAAIRAGTQAHVLWSSCAAAQPLQRPSPGACCTAGPAATPTPWPRSAAARRSRPRTPQRSCWAPRSRPRRPWPGGAHSGRDRGGGRGGWDHGGKAELPRPTATTAAAAPAAATTTACDMARGRRWTWIGRWEPGRARRLQLAGIRCVVVLLGC